MFSELYDKKSIFRKKYLENLINRFTNASLGVEGVEGNLADTIQAMNIYQQTQALEYAFSLKKNEKLTINDIKQIEDLLTGGEVTDFRKTRAEVVGSNVRRSKPQFIYMDMYTLFDNYYNVWKDLDPFLREAYFHIRFLHIHPFEDGNGRTARILLIRNLCASKEVPCVITKEVKTEYCSYIENNDAEGLAKFFKQIADKELNTILNLYRNLDSKGLIKENRLSVEQEEEYNRIIGLQNNPSPEKETEYPLRNLDNLIKLFKRNSLSDSVEGPLHMTGLYRYEQYLDEKSGDRAVYVEDNKFMTISINNDPRFFKIDQQVNNLRFTIDGEVKLPQEFEYELKHQQIEQEATTKKKL